MFRVAAALGTYNPDLKPDQYLWRERASGADGTLEIVVTDFGFAGSEPGAPYPALWGWIGVETIALSCPPAWSELRVCAPALPACATRRASDSSEYSTCPPDAAALAAFPAFFNCFLLETYMVQYLAVWAQLPPPSASGGAGAARFERFAGLSDFARDRGAALLGCASFATASLAKRVETGAGACFALRWIDDVVPTELRAAALFFSDATTPVAGAPPRSARAATRVVSLGSRPFSVSLSPVTPPRSRSRSPPARRVPRTPRTPPPEPEAEPEEKTAVARRGSPWSEMRATFVGRRSPAFATPRDLGRGDRDRGAIRGGTRSP
jgi:hypothetical protein